MKAYQKPQVIAYEFNREDVITTSGVIGSLDSADYVDSAAWREDWNQ